jgi:hypothetical protein
MAKTPTDSGKALDLAFENQDKILLGVLSAVDRDAQVSQRTISRELGVALGLANAYFKRCVRKGWIKVQQVPRRRYAYYLTPQGFAEKTRLAGQYFVSSFNFFRRARTQISELMQDCAAQQRRRIAFAGVSELAEVGVLCAHDFPIVLAGIVDRARAGEKFCGLPVVATFKECGPVDAVIVTALMNSEAAYQKAVEAVGAERVLTPRILQIALPAAPTAVEGAQAAE